MPEGLRASSDAAAQQRVLSDDVLLRICGLSRGIDGVTDDWLEELRLVEALFRRKLSELGDPWQSRLHLVATHLLALLGRIAGQNPRLPFGYEDTGRRGSESVDREMLEQIVKQFVGLLTTSNMGPLEVTRIVEMAVSEAISYGYATEDEKYDAWRPGMKSGSGWRCSISATPYGYEQVRKALERRLAVVTADPWSRDLNSGDDEDLSAEPEEPVAESTTLSEDEAEAESEALEVVAVKLFGRGERCEVRGIKKPPLNECRYDIIEALLKAGEEGLKFRNLAWIRPGARRSLQGLCKDKDWAGVIQMAGKTGCGYRIRK